MSGWKTRIRKRATELLNLPPDALLDLPRVTCIGGAHVVVEGSKGLIEVDSELIVLDLGDQHLYVRGHDFEVTLVTEREVHVQGAVVQLDYLPNEQVAQ